MCPFRMLWPLQVMCPCENFRTLSKYIQAFSSLKISKCFTWNDFIREGRVLGVHLGRELPKKEMSGPETGGPFGTVQSSRNGVSNVLDDVRRKFGSFGARETGGGFPAGSVSEATKKETSHRFRPPSADLFRPGPREFTLRSSRMPAMRVFQELISLSGPSTALTPGVSVSNRCPPLRRSEPGGETLERTSPGRVPHE